MEVALALIRDSALLSLLALWVASVGWMARDARGRLRRPQWARLVALAGLALPGAGLLLYLAIRPPDSELDRRERRAVRRLLELELAGERCLLCREEVRPEFRCCPACGEQLGGRCEACGEPLRLGWQVCPCCEEPARPGLRLHPAA